MKCLEEVIRAMSTTLKKIACAACLTLFACATPSLNAPEGATEDASLHDCVLTIVQYVTGQSHMLVLPHPDKSPTRMRWIQHTPEEIIDEVCARSDEMKKRYPLITQAREKAYVQEDARGYLCVNDSQPFASANERNVIQRMVAAENKDRKQLYQEVARLASTTSVSVVEEAFGHAWAKAGLQAKHSSVLMPS